MKLEFSWSSATIGSHPICKSDTPDSDDLSPLACLFMDDGGTDAGTSLAWLREGLSRVDAALSGNGTARVSWDREAWGSEMMATETVVYSLHDERCAERLPTAAFRQALLEWSCFIEQGYRPDGLVIDLG